MNVEATNRYLLVGQAPSRDGNDAFTGKSGERLARLAGVDHESFLELFDRRNLLPEYPGAARGKGDLFPLKDARENWLDELWPYLDRWQGVVLVGKATARVAGIHRFGFAEWLIEFWTGPPTLAWIPHPSGVNHLYNQRDVRQKVGEFMRDMVRDELDSRKTDIQMVAHAICPECGGAAVHDGKNWKCKWWAGSLCASSIPDDKVWSTPRLEPV